MKQDMSVTCYRDIDKKIIRRWS